MGDYRHTDADILYRENLSVVKNTEADILLDCFSCVHSQGAQERGSCRTFLVCSLTITEAKERCEAFVYEPGTDQGVRNV